MHEKPSDLAEMNQREIKHYENWVKKANFKIE
jgi:hypothetical protein